MRLAAFLAATIFSFSLGGRSSDSSDPQSLIPGTMVKVSLRVKSGPREFLTGPIGPEMTGRWGPRRLVMFDGSLEEEGVRRRGLYCPFISERESFVSIVEVVRMR